MSMYVYGEGEGARGTENEMSKATNGNILGHNLLKQNNIIMLVILTCNFGHGRS